MIRDCILRERQPLPLAEEYLLQRKKSQFYRILSQFSATRYTRLAALTEFRGIPSLADALEFLKTHISEKQEGILLSQFDILEVSTREKIPGNRKCYKTYDKYLEEISKHNLSYDNDDWDDTELPALIHEAYERFKSKANEISFNSDTNLIVQSDKIAYQLSTDKKPEMLSQGDIVSEPFVKITVDHNLLHRLL